MKVLHDVLEVSTNHSATYHLHHKEKPGIIESAHKTFLLRPFPKLLLLRNTFFACVVEFTTHHWYYKDKLVGNPTWTFVYIANYLYFFSGWNNLSTASLFGHNNGAYTNEPSLVTKKRELPKTPLHLVSDTFQPPFLNFSSTLSKIRPAMLRFAAISVWQLSSTLASFSSLLTSEASFNLSCAGQIIEFLSDNQALLNKKLQWQIFDKSCGLRYVKLDL